MALCICEGLDRSGKSTIAKYFESKGYDIIHMSAPPKGQTSDLFLDEMVELVSRAASHDIFLDRSYYGENAIWPQIYGRKSLLNDENLEILREIEESVGVKRILMHDTNIEAHWQRCVDNKEPLTKAQFARARSLYSSMAAKYGFESITLQQFIKQFPDAEQFLISVPVEDPNVETTTHKISNDNSSTVTQSKTKEPDQKILLEKANAINDILNKPILKQKGPQYEDLEKDIRDFLNNKLAGIFGKTHNEDNLSKDEILFYKAMYKRATEKGEHK